MFSSLVLLLLTLATQFLEGLTYQRLPGDVLPIRYHLVIQPTFQPNFTFQGNLTIEMWMNNTDQLSLDVGEGLTVQETRLTFDDLWPVDHTIERTEGRLQVRTVTKMKNSYKVTLRIIYHGQIRTQLSGFFLSWYDNERWMASTQFEANSAREAFPCFDDPSMRARLNLELLLDPTLQTASNTPIQTSTIEGGLRRVSFAESAPMPTYLMAWSVFPADMTPQEREVTSECGQTTFRVWARPGLEEESQLALGVAPRIIQALEQFTGIKCKATWDKMDLVTLPDFQAGAMENWGHITFREYYLLYNSNVSCAEDLQNTFMIIAHELAHHWFGNLVTPHWWSYVWLNEGFARFMQYMIMDQINPEMRGKEQFVVEGLQLALLEDGPESHPLTKVDLNSTDDIEDMFDTITYAKGASILWTIQSAVGEESFKTSVNRYLADRIEDGGVATPADLFSAFPNLPEEMVVWTQTPGYPVVVVSQSNFTLTLRQITISGGWNETEESSWLIPIHVYLENGTLSQHWLRPNQTLQLTVNTTEVTWYIINYNQAGYMRVHYEEQRLAPEVVMSLPPPTRAMLANDALSLSRLGLLPYNSSLSLVSYLTEEVDYVPWFAALRALSNIKTVIKDSSIEPHWNRHVQQLMDNVLYQIGLSDPSEEDSHLTKLLRINLLKYSCHFEHPNCTARAEHLASNLREENPEVKRGLLCTAIKRGNSTLWETVYQLYKNESVPTEKQLLLNSLTCTTDPTSVQKLLRALLTSDVKRQNFFLTISGVCSTNVGMNETFSFLKENYNQILDYHFWDRQKIMKILSPIFSRMTNVKQLNEVKQWAEDQTDLKVNSLVKKTEKSLALREHNLHELKRYFSPSSEESDKEKPYDDKNMASTLTYNHIYIFSSLFIYLFNVHIYRR